MPLSLLEAVLLPLVKQISLRASQVDDLRTPIPVLFHLRTFSAIVRITNPRTAANHAPPLVGPVVALVADSNEGTGPDVRVAHHTFAVAFFAEAPDRDAGLLAAHYEVGMMFRHGGALRLRSTAAALSSATLRRRRLRCAARRDDSDVPLCGSAGAAVRRTRRGALALWKKTNGSAKGSVIALHARHSDFISMAEAGNASVSMN